MKVMCMMKSMLLVMAVVGMCLGATGCTVIADSYNVTQTLDAERTVIGDSAGKLYSRAIKAQGQFVFTSGHIPINPETGEAFTGDIQTQVRFVLDALQEGLEQAGTSFANVVKVNIYITDLDYYGPLNEVYREYFPENPPARACVVVKELVFGVGVEIDMVAVVK